MVDLLDRARSAVGERADLPGMSLLDHLQELRKRLLYSIIFIVAGIITPTPDVLTMCVFAAPMLVLYLISIGVAHLVHPEHRNKKKQEA